MSQQPFDLLIENFDDDEEFRLRIETDPETGEPLYTSALAEPLKATLSEASYSYADVPPDQEMTFSQSTFVGGKGHYYAKESTTTDGFWEGNGESRQPGKYILAPVAQNYGLTDPDTSVGYSFPDNDRLAVKCGLYYGGSYYIVVADLEQPVGATNYLLRSDNSFEWFVCGDPFGDDICVDMIVYRSKMLFGLLSGPYFYSSNFAGTAASVTFAQPTTGARNIRYFAILNEILVGADLSAGNVIYTTVQDAGVSNTSTVWDSGTQIGDPTLERAITGLTVLDDMVVVAKREGFYTWTQDGEVLSLSLSTQGRDTTGIAGKHMAVQGSVLFTTVGNEGLWAYSQDGGWLDLTNLYSRTNPEGAHFLGVFSASGGVYVLLLTKNSDGEEVIEIETITLEGVRQSVGSYLNNTSSFPSPNFAATSAIGHTPVMVGNLIFFTANALLTNNAVLFALDLGPYQIPVDPRTMTLKVDVKSQFTLNNPSVLTTSWIDYGFPTLTKSPLRLKLRALVPEDTELEIWYAYDDTLTPFSADHPTGWTLLGTLTDSSTPDDGSTDVFTFEFPPSAISDSGDLELFRQIRLGFELTGSVTNDVAVVLYSYTLFSVPSFDRRRMIQASCPVAPAVRARTGVPNTADTLQNLKDKIKRAAAAPTPLRITEPDGTTMRAKLTQMSYRLKKVRSSVTGPTDEQWTYNLTFLEALYA